MNTERITKVLALAMEANPDLPIPLSTDNIDLDDIVATPNGVRNTRATMYARDTGEIFRYVGNVDVVYDRIDIARYWQKPDLIESPDAQTVKDLLAVLRTRYGLDVLDSEVLNINTALPDNGTVNIVINDILSPLYIGAVDVAFTKDAGLSQQDGVAYELGDAPVGTILAYSDAPLTLECSINAGRWTAMLRTRNPKTGQYQYRSTTDETLANTQVRIRGGAVQLMDNLGNYVPLTYLTLYRGSPNALGYCSGIRTLIGVKPGVFYYRPDLVNADYLFDGCTQLTDVPEHLFSPCLGLLSAKAVFRNTPITAVPASVFESCSRLTDLTSAFEQCKQLQTLPAELFRTNTALTTLRRCFLGCVGLQSGIPAQLLTPLVNLTDAGYLFAACSSLTTVPTGLLKNQTNLLSVEGLFSQCTGIKTIPADLFTTNARLNNASRLFEGDYQITGIPAGLFQFTPNLEYAENTFAGTGILTTPEILFTYVRRLLSIDRIFANCTGLTVIPDALMKPLLRLQSANGVWQNCTGITAIPVGLLKANTNIISLDWAFANTRITQVPNDLVQTLTKLVSMVGTFSRTAITRIVASDTFAYNSQLSDVSQLFYKCSSLTNVYPGLFQQCTKLKTLRGTFAYTALSDNIGTVFTNMQSRATIANIAGLYQGCASVNGSFATNLKDGLRDSAIDWTNNDTVQGCVAGCVGLSDYAAVGTIYKTPVPTLV